MSKHSSFLSFQVFGAAMICCIMIIMITKVTTLSFARRHPAHFAIWSIGTEVSILSMGFATTTVNNPNGITSFWHDTAICVYLGIKMLLPPLLLLVAVTTPSSAVGLLCLAVAAQWFVSSRLHLQALSVLMITHHQKILEAGCSGPTFGRNADRCSTV